MGYLAVPIVAVFDGLYALIPKEMARQLDEKTREVLEQECQPLITEGSLSFDPEVNKVDVFRFHGAIWFLEAFIGLVMAGGGVVFYRLLLLFDLPAKLACLSALVLALGTTMMFYARVPYTLVPNAVLLLLAFYWIVLVQKEPKAKPRIQAARLVAAGLALGVTVAIHYIQIIGAGLVFLYAWNRLGTRRVWWVVLGGLPLGLLIMLYHYAAFDYPFVYPYRYAIPILATDNQQELIRIDQPTWERMVGIVVGCRRGLFFYNPVLLYLVMLMAREGLYLRRYLPETALSLALLAGFVLFQASTPILETLWGVGPRYAGAVVPFLMFGVIFVKSRRQLQVFYWLAGASALINWLLVQYDVESQHSYFPLKDTVAYVLHSGPSSSLLRIGFWFAGISDPMATWVVGIVAYFILATILVTIWRETSTAAPPGSPVAGQGASTQEIKA